MKSRIKNPPSLSNPHPSWSQLSLTLAPRGTPQFKGHYWSLPVDKDGVDKIRQALEKKLQRPLKHRSESHLTLITPPEWTALQSPANSPAPTAPPWPETPNSFRVICLAESRISPQLATYYLVVELDPAYRWRESFFSQKGLLAPAYFPHITVGFTEQDLHLKDGVTHKDQSQCLNWSLEELNVTP